MDSQCLSQRSTDIMAFSVFSMLVLVAITGILEGKPAVSNEEVTFTARFLKVNPQTGKLRSLHKQDIEQLGKGENHQLRLHFDNDLPPLDMRLTQGSVWNRDSVVVVRKGPIRMEMPQALDGNCFLRGKLVEVDGAVSINRCGIMSGTINTPTHNYQIEEQQLPEGEEEILGYTVFKVTRMVQEQESQEIDREYERKIMNKVNTDLSEQMTENRRNGTIRRKRDAFYFTVIIEMIVYLDANYVAHLSRERGLNTENKMKNFIIDKWNIVQSVFDDPERIGARVIIDLKAVEIWRNNPTGYPADEAAINVRLRWFCRNTPEASQFDIKALYTKNTGGHQLGMAYTGGVCRENWNCFVVLSPTPSARREIHELGHSIGFRHDPVIGDCDSRGGFMGWADTYRYLPCYKRVLMEKIYETSHTCLFEEFQYNRVSNLEVTATTPAGIEPSTTVDTIYISQC